MPTIQYPGRNQRRGWYRLNVSPFKETTVSAAWGECLNFKISPDEALLEAATDAVVVFQCTDGESIDGETFQLFGFTFTVDNTLTNGNTATSVEFNSGDAAIHAQHLIGMVNSSPELAGAICTTEIIGGLVNITITIPATEFDPFVNTAPSNQSIVSEVNGTAAELANGYGIAYRVWAKIDGATKPISEWLIATPALDEFGQPTGDVEFEVNDILRGYLSTKWQYAPLTMNDKKNAYIDPFFRIEWWIEYGWREINASNCQAVLHSLNLSPHEWTTHAAVQEEDKWALLPYLGQNARPRKFLTRDPAKWVCRDSIRFLWIYADDNERYDANGGIEYTYEVTHNGTAGGGTITEDLGPIDGAWVLPAGPANIQGGIPAAATYYIVRFLANGQVIAEREYKIKPVCCCDLEVYFLGDLGGFETLCFDEIEEIFTSGQTETVCLPCECFDDDRPLFYGERLGTGGTQVIKSEYLRKFRARVTIDCDEEKVRVFVESFLKSPVKMVRYKNGEDGYQRGVFVDGQDFSLWQEDDNTVVECTFYFHKKLNVQI